MKNQVVNTVPSIDKLWEDKYKYEDFTKNPKQILINFLEDLLNGVETTKEQPKLKKHEAIAVHDCYCGTIKKGQVYNKLFCDLGCMYPGA